MVSPDQANAEIPDRDDPSFVEDKLELRVEAAQGDVIHGHVRRRTRQRLTGIWKQGDNELPLNYDFG